MFTCALGETSLSPISYQGVQAMSPKASSTQPTPPSSKELLAFEQQESRSWSRMLARLSIVAAMLCLSMNCVFNQLTAKSDPASMLGWNRIVGTCSIAVVVLGVLMGLFAMVRGIQRRSTDTATIAAIGLVLNLGIIFVTIWALSIVRDMQPAP